MSTSTSENVFTILAFDQRSSYRRLLPEGTLYDSAVQIKCEVVDALSPYTSAVLLDPYYGFRPAMEGARSGGLLMALENSGYVGEPTYRRVSFDPDWTVGKIKRLGASAVKLLVYYHPDAGDLADELEEMMADIIAECHHFDLPIFLEPISYSLEASQPKSSVAFAETRPAVVRETARRLSRLGADVLKLEFPIDPALDPNEQTWEVACQDVSAACSAPWVLLSAGVDFEMFARQARVACRAGASGFLAGRAIWKEITTLAPAARARFLEDAAIPRIKKLVDIAVRSARPWTDFYSPQPAREDWFRAYPALSA